MRKFFFLLLTVLLQFTSYSQTNYPDNEVIEYIFSTVESEVECSYLIYCDHCSDYFFGYMKFPKDFVDTMLERIPDTGLEGVPILIECPNDHNNNLVQGYLIYLNVMNDNPHCINCKLDNYD